MYNALIPKMNGLGYGSCGRWTGNFSLLREAHAKYNTAPLFVIRQVSNILYNHYLYDRTKNIA